MNKQKIEELENTIKQVQKQIEELKKEDEMPKFEYPNKGDKVWYISPNGKANSWYWLDRDCERDAIHHGNIFSTLEEAEFECERKKVIEELKLFAEPEDREWDDTVSHYFIGYDYVYGGKIIIRGNICYKHNDIYFATQKDAQKAIDYVGRDRVKKYYLRVED